MPDPENQQKAPGMTEKELRDFLERWDQSGDFKTSLYYRLQSLLYQKKK